MAEHIKKAHNFSPMEQAVLIDEVEARHGTLFAKLNNIVTNENKRKAWEEIAAKANAVNPGLNRTVLQIKKKWQEYQSRTKKKEAERRRDMKQTDGKLTRVRPLVDHVRTVSSELFQPYQHISAVERMLPSKHQFSGIRQFVKNKPVCFGIKLWVLACSVTGYTCEFAVYLGKRFTDFKDRTKGLGYNGMLQ